MASIVTAPGGCPWINPQQLLVDSIIRSSNQSRTWRRGHGESRREVHPASDDLDVARRFARGGPARQRNLFPLVYSAAPPHNQGVSADNLFRGQRS
jgi:hypothetical protein